MKPVTSSIDALSWKITDFKKHHNLTSGADAANSAEYQHFIQEVIVKIGLGIQDANGLELADLYKNDYLNDLLADMVSRRAELGW